MNEIYQWQSDKVAEVTFINKVYGIMTGGLMLTALTAKFIGMNVAPQTIANMMLPCIILELVLVFAMGPIVNKASTAVGLICFAAYAILNGVTLSSIFLVYKLASIMQIFMTTSLTFGAMCLYGVSTKRDLTSVGNLCFMALIGIVIASFINIFLRSPAMDLAFSILGVFVFVGLTAYDSQKIKKIQESGCNHNGIAIMGALQLYLDFINLFLYLLRLFGKRRD